MAKRAGATTISVVVTTQAVWRRGWAARPSCTHPWLAPLCVESHRDTVAPGAPARGVPFWRWCSLRSETAWFPRLRPPLATRRPSTTTRQDRALTGSGRDTGGLAALPPAPIPLSASASAATPPPASAPDATARFETGGLRPWLLEKRKPDRLRAGARWASGSPGLRRRGVMPRGLLCGGLDDVPDRPTSRAR